jgi:hypothetical protein
MTLEMHCEHCGKSRAYEYAMGDRSGLCWREACAKSRQLQAERYRQRMHDDEMRERARRVYPFKETEGITESGRPGVETKETKQ